MLPNYGDNRDRYIKIYNDRDLDIITIKVFEKSKIMSFTIVVLD